MSTYRRDCDQCGLPYVGGGRKFCSHHCRQIWWNLHNNPAKTPEARAKISAARKGKATTTGRVMPEAQRANVAAALRGRGLTPEHRAAIGAGVRRAGITPPRNTHLIGPAHPSWKGGHSRAREADFHNPAYKAYRRAVLERDDWTCVDCGERGRHMAVHHPDSWAEHPDRRYDPDNGVTLCRPCHSTRHRGVPRPTNAGPRTRAELRSIRL